MTQREAVWAACEELDVRTSLNTLQGRAQQLYGGEIHVSACCTYRGEYRKANKLKVDCRTYGKRGQSRRDMQNDHTASLKQVKRLNYFSKLKRPSMTSLLNLLGEGGDMFHSVEQMRNAIADYQELKQAA
jgi:hypothetical protein